MLDVPYWLTEDFCREHGRKGAAQLGREFPEEVFSRLVGRRCEAMPVHDVTPRSMLYLAGPYTHPDPVENTHRAILVATIIYEQTTWVPLLPHITLLWHMVTPRPPEFWYELDLHQLAHCDAIVRLPGASTGADREMEAAAGLGLEIVDFASLPLAAQDAWL